MIALASDPADGGRVFAAVTNCDIMRSLDGGVTWQAIMYGADPG